MFRPHSLWTPPLPSDHFSQNPDSPQLKGVSLESSKKGCLVFLMINSILQVGDQRLRVPKLLANPSGSTRGPGASLWAQGEASGSPHHSRLPVQQMVISGHLLILCLNYINLTNITQFFVNHKGIHIDILYPQEETLGLNHHHHLHHHHHCYHHQHHHVITITATTTTPASSPSSSPLLPSPASPCHHRHCHHHYHHPPPHVY